MTKDCENVLSLRHVVADWKVELRRDRNVILASDFFFGCCSSIPAERRILRVPGETIAP